MKYDITQKNLEAYNDVFADIVNVLLFHGKTLIVPDDLEQADPYSYYKAAGRIRGQERDVSKYWRHNQFRIAFLGIENQILADRDMPLRVIGYDGAAYRNQLFFTKDSKGKRVQNRSERYPVITLVLYFGTSPWKTSRSLKACLQIPEALRPFVNDYRINLFEIAFLPREQLDLFKSDFKVVADYFVQKRMNRGYKPSRQKLMHVREVLQMLSALTKDNRFSEDINDIEEGDEYNMEVILDRVIEKGRKEGRMEGRKEGRMEGRKEGRMEGRKEGRILEAVDIYKKEMKLDESIIINQLVRKFGLTPEIARKYL